jgi:transcriptional regulator with XRE-family HTH domain
MEKSIITEEHRRLARLLRQIRIESGLTQVDLAQCLGESQSAISKVESGQRRLDLIQLSIYAKALGIKLRTLVDRWEREAKKR